MNIGQIKNRSGVIGSLNALDMSFLTNHRVSQSFIRSGIIKDSSLNF